MRALDTRLLLLALPALTASALAVVLLGAQAERSVRAARVYGGPTGLSEQSYRLELVDSFQGVQAPVAGGSVRVVLRGPAGHEARWSGAVGPDAVAEVTPPLLPAAPRYELGVFQGEQVLAEGTIELSAEAWLAPATRRGGWQTFKLDDTTELELAPARGILAAPFTSELLLRVRRAGRPLRAELELSADGASVDGRRVVSSETPARVALTPRAHVVGLRVRVSIEGAPPRDVERTLTVAPGAFHAVLDGARLIVTSPVPRERAYYTLVSERRRVSGGSVVLTADERGGATGYAELPRPPTEPLWAVVASTPDLLSAGRVGMPIGPHAEPALTLDVPEKLLLDGLPRALSRESARRKQARFTAVTICALGLLLAVLLLLGRARRSAEVLARHLEQSGLDAAERRALSAERPLWLWAALGAVALGFAALLIFALVAR